MFQVERGFSKDASSFNAATRTKQMVPHLREPFGYNVPCHLDTKQNGCVVLTVCIFNLFDWNSGFVGTMLSQT